MAQLSQLLLFDSDPSGLDTLTYGFERDGASVVGTGDTTKALDLIQGATPSLVVINLRDPDKIGIDLLRAVTSNPRTRNLACVVIGREDSRAAALVAGAFVFLSVPLFVRDILAACRLVSAASVPGSRPSPDTELTLQLRDLDGIYFLVRALAASGRSAVVEVRHGPSRGELRFIDGVLTSAQLGSVEGLPALHHMLLWEEAELRFKFRNVVRRGTQLSMKSSQVIEECDRFLRDFAHDVKDLGTARTVYAPNAGQVQPSSAFPSEVLPLLRLFDGKQDLGHVLDDSPFRVFDTLKIIKRFAGDGAISPVAPPPAPPQEIVSAAGGPAALDFWFQQPAPAFGAEVGPRSEIAASPRKGRIPSKKHAPVSRGAVAAGEIRASAAALPVVSSVPAEPTISVALAVPEASPAAVSAFASPAVVVVSTVSAIVAASAGPAVASAVPAAPETTSTAPGIGPALAADAFPRAAASVTRGEIRVASPTQRLMDAVVAAGAPSVLVEIGPLPTPMPMAPFSIAPLSAQSAPVSVPASAPASVIVAPVTPTPLATARPRTMTPARGGTAAAALDHRPPSNGFNDVEADFFDREADLYKRESVESFENLDRKPGPGRPLGAPQRKS